MTEAKYRELAHTPRLSFPRRWEATARQVTTGKWTPAFAGVTGRLSIRNLLDSIRVANADGGDAGRDGARQMHRASIISEGNLGA